MKKWILALIGISFMAIGCNRTMIVYKPKKQLDPMPVTTGHLASESTENTPKTDPLSPNQWNLSKVGMANKGNGKKQFPGNVNIKVALLSTGVDYNHEDLVGRVSVNAQEITQKGAADRPGPNQEDDDKNGLVDDIVGYDVVDGDGLAYDRHGAGTAVAGIIAAKGNNGTGIVGLMDKVTLFPVRYINNNGQASLGHLLEAIDVSLKQKPDVIFIQNVHLQYGGQVGDPKLIASEMGILKSRLDKVAKAKIPVVIGAGDDMETFSNEEVEKLIRTYDNIIVVSSSDQNDELAFLAKHSIKYVHTTAPGEGILTTKPLNQYGEVAGTAFAAAHVTAAIALAKSEMGDQLTLEKITQGLIDKEGSDKVSAMKRYVRGRNRLNIAKFIEYVKK